MQWTFGSSISVDAPGMVANAKYSYNCGHNDDGDRMLSPWTEKVNDALREAVKVGNFETVNKKGTVMVTSLNHKEPTSLDIIAGRMGDFLCDDDEMSGYINELCLLRTGECVMDLMEGDMHDMYRDVSDEAYRDVAVKFLQAVCAEIE